MHESALEKRSQIRIWEISYHKDKLFVYIRPNLSDMQYIYYIFIFIWNFAQQLMFYRFLHTRFLLASSLWSVATLSECRSMKNEEIKTVWNN